MHPRYDSMGLSLPRRPWTDELSQFLHISSPLELKNKVEQLVTDYSLWAKIVKAQREFYEQRFNTYAGGAAPVEKYLKIGMEQAA